MVVSATVSSRAALAGNPSDGYGGAVCSVLVPSMAATVHVVDGPACALGAAANFAGSGGAIVGVVPKASQEFEDGLRRAGLEVRTWNAR